MTPTERAHHRRRRRTIVAAALVTTTLTACADPPAPKSLTAGSLNDRDELAQSQVRPEPVQPAKPRKQRALWRRGDPTAAQLRKLAWCESGKDNSAYGADGHHFGAYQFDLETWASVGGHGNPARASLAEQSRRAVLLFRQRGWQPWAASSACTGLR